MRRTLGIGCDLHWKLSPGYVSVEREWHVVAKMQGFALTTDDLSVLNLPSSTKNHSVLGVIMMGGSYTLASGTTLRT